MIKLAALVFLIWMAGKFVRWLSDGIEEYKNDPYYRGRRK